MKKTFLFLFFVMIFNSCTEDVSREINTELTREAEQFFQFTEVLSETNYLGNISYQDYFRLNSKDLPGCPTLIRSLNSRIIQLDYSNPVDCEKENKNLRSGKISVDFSLSTSTNPSWTLTFEDYSFDGIKIQGSKRFKTLSTTENQESFENLQVELSGNLGFSASGTLTHAIERENFRPFRLSTRGKIEGKNPVGREFNLVINASKTQLFSCLDKGWILPQSGSESWIVSRGSGGSLDYKVSFQSGLECNPVVIATLPDGRSLQLNP
jgi:hypothetical protein